VPIFKQDNFPDFVHSQMLFPWWHDRGPRESFIRQADSTFGHTPEDECFLQLRNGTRISKVRRNWIERKGMEAPTVQVIPVTEVAVLVEDLSTFTYILEVPLSVLVPGIGIGLHQAAHPLFHNIGVAILLIVLTFRINAVGVLRRLKRIGLTVDFGAGWWRGMYRP